MAIDQLKWMTRTFSTFEINLFYWFFQAEKKGCTASEYGKLLAICAKKTNFDWFYWRSKCDFFRFQGLVFGIFELVIFVLSPIFGECVTEQHFDVSNKICNFSQCCLHFYAFCRPVYESDWTKSII